MNYARIESGAVAQIIVIPDGESAEFIRDDLGLSGEWVACPDGSVGDQYQDGQFVPLPPDATPAVPQSVSRAQGKAALITAGLWDQVLAYVDGIADPTQQALARVALDDTTEWRRDSPLLATAAAALGLSEQQLDDLFVAAAAIVL